MSRPGAKHNPTSITARNLSDKSTKSINSKQSSTLSKNSPSITSKWGIGWQTPTLMIACYAGAVVIAVAHLLLFQYIEGKEADGQNQVAPQSYISTASNVLANGFGFLLRGSLAVAFVQYLWCLLRVSTMKVSTIELLFCIRNDPFALSRPSAIRAAPLLCALAMVMWLSQIATSFPPGAITVATTQRISYKIIPVPTFNASFMGNESGADANQYSLTILEAMAPSGFTTGGLDGSKDANLITRLASQVLVTGEALSMPSPCGVNCSYTVDFEGPYFECTKSTAQVIYRNNGTLIGIYNGTWADQRAAYTVGSHYNGTYTLSRFNSSVFTPLAANVAALNNVNGSILMQKDELECIPGRANYTITNTYENNIQKRTIATTPISPIINLAPLTHQSEVIVPGFCLNGTTSLGIAPANWSDDSRAYYRDNNVMAIIDAIMFKLAGNFTGALVKPPEVDYVAPANDSLWIHNLEWQDDVKSTDQGNVVGTEASSTSNIGSTRFNAAFGKYSSAQLKSPAFNVTQDMLNDYILNMTTSVMMAYANWNTTANASSSNTISVYSFSRPYNLIVPYFLSLVLSIPFILVGGFSLIKNGVSAVDGGVMQILATSTGSAVLDKAAAGGCLGGNESFSQELKDLEIRFGELISRDDPGVIKRAGFGVESEVVPLRKGVNYGIATWI